uniref:Shikimate O-hydroxycinnamoyltransferase n=1 Tax=Opuntia streptacantha TaxID=393608 RepID=A0A7C9EZH2_OPUST
MGVHCDFSVTTTTKSTVAAAVPMQGDRLPLSNLDLLLPPLDVNVFFCYKNNEPTDVESGTNNVFKYKVGVLKKALAQALAYFYPYAGEVVMNSAGEPELLCNNRGVEFVEAFADVQLCELDFYNPDRSIEGKLVPRKKGGVLSVQVTELKCGAIVVACAFDHRVSDAYSANMFWVTWSEMAALKPISKPPSFRRSLVEPRSPTQFNSALDDMYIRISSLPPPPKPSESQTVEPLVTRVYYTSAEQLCELQALASKGCEKRASKLQSFSAFLWQLIASHACQMGEENANKVTKMGIVVDGRSRLREGESEKKAKALASYFGNVLSIPYGEETCGSLKDKSLSNMVDLVHDFLDKAITKDHFLDLIDWVEMNRPELAMTRIYCTKEGDGPALVVSSGLPFPVSEVDFGWGKPTFGSYHFPWGGSCGYVMPMPSPSGNGDWIVYMFLSKDQLEFIEAEAPNVFKPFTLDLISNK